MIAPVLLNLALFLAACVLAAGMAEVAVRLVAPQQLIIKRPDIWKPVEGLGWIHHANVATTINTGEGSVHLFTDDRGFRVGEAGRRTGKKRVLVLGDSFMEAVQVEHEESLAGLLARRLSDSLREPVEVWNTGVEDWNPNHYLIQAREVFAEHPFDAVLVALYVGNDVVRSRVASFTPRTPTETHAFRVPRGLGWNELIDAILYPINDVLEVRSHLFILMKRRLQTVLMRVGLTAAYFPQDFWRHLASDPRWDTTGEICEEIAAVASRHGARPLFVLIPTPFQVDSLVFTKYIQGFDIDPATVDLEQPNRMLGQALERRGLTVVDVLPAFREARDDGIKLYGTVDEHLTADGHRVVADQVEPLLAPALREAI